MEIIAVVTGCLGFLLSLTKWIYDAIKNRENYGIHMVTMSPVTHNSIRFFICIENKSSAPLTIVSISCKGYECDLLPKPIKGHPSDWDFQHTDQFPLCIPAHGAIYSYLEFSKLNAEFVQPKIGDPVLFEIQTTRRVSKRSVLTNIRSGYLPI